MIDLQLNDGLSLMKSVSTKTVDLVLTDPPYIISKPSGMQKYIDETGDVSANAVRTDFGSWDRDFTMEELETTVNEYFRILKDGGTAIVFFDKWKVTPLKEMMEAAGFKQLRLIHWFKTNPVPINSKVNYLNNSLDLAVLGIKKRKPTFNSQYDKGIYEYPIYQDSVYKRFHTTQKSLLLFEELIKKHSNQGDLVIDTFSGSGTTALAAERTGREFLGCEIDPEYVRKSNERLTAYRNLNKGNVL